MDFLTATNFERATYRDGFNSAMEDVMNFINSLDSQGMSVRDVRSAIYHHCLETGL